MKQTGFIGVTLYWTTFSMQILIAGMSKSFPLGSSAIGSRLLFIKIYFLLLTGGVMPSYKWISLLAKGKKLLKMWRNETEFT